MTKTLVIYLQPRRGINPGHMVLGQEGGSQLPAYFGFRFDPAALPRQCSDSRALIRHLAANAVPGIIVDEARFVQDLLAEEEGNFLEKRAEFDGEIETHLPPTEDWRAHARYSFNPDDFHRADDPCYNCVTWVARIANELIDGFLPTVRQGRIGLMFDHLNELKNQSEEPS